MSYAVRVKSKNVELSLCVRIMDEVSTFLFHPISQNESVQPIFEIAKTKKANSGVICKCHVTYGWLGIHDIDSVALMLFFMD